MQNLEQIREELQRSGQAERLKTLANSADGRKLSQMLDRRAVEEAAKKGDSEALRRAVGSVLATEEGRRLSAALEKLFRGQDHG